MRNPFKYFKTSPEIIRLAVMMYIHFPLSLRNVEDLLHERGIDITHETIRFWWNRFGPMFAVEIRRKHADRMRDWPPESANAIETETGSLSSDSTARNILSLHQRFRYFSPPSLAANRDIGAKGMLSQDIRRWRLAARWAA